MTQHTPGPWIADTLVGAIFTDATYDLLADTYPMGVGDMSANARLIAAAPEMLEALKEADDYLTGNYNLNSIGAMSQLHRNFKKAITKAKGGAA